MRALRAALPAFIAGFIGLSFACGGSGDGRTVGQEDPELQRKVAELIPRLAQLAHLEVRSVPVARRTDTEALESYLLERLETEFPGDTLRRLERAYAAFGLLPDTLDLRRLLVDLMLEQAVGYYDPVRDVFFVREGAPEELVDAVLVHELVHALQDQHLDLDSLMHSVEANDARTAVQSAIEGHATLAMMAFQIARMTGRDVEAETLPDIQPEMMDAMAAAATYPELARAPAIVQRPLLFAYLGGARYVQRLWRQQANQPAPFGPWLPASTEQLLHTEKILGERDGPVDLQLDQPPDGWRSVWRHDLGELEIQIYLEEHLGDRAAASRAAAGWDGDVYLLIERDGASALLWYSAWDAPGEADEFVEAYRRAFLARFGGSAVGDSLVAPERKARVARSSEGGTPLVRIWEGPADLAPPDWPQVVIQNGRD